MTQPLTSKKLWITGGLASLLLGTSWVGVAVKTQAQDQAQDQVGQEQATALEIVTKMTEAQRTYYQKNGKFQVVVQEMAEDLNLTLPPSFNYAVRTSFDGAYIYVQPAQTPMADQLKAYVGG
ncbi:MAG: type IV pilin-like G/H family protein, partial [Crocosphaera sp.]